MHTVLIVVFMVLYYAAENTVHCGTFCKDTQNQMNPLQLNEISNRIRRDASEVPNGSDITKLDMDTKVNLLQDILLALPSQDLINALLSIPKSKRSYLIYDSTEDQENIDPKNQLEQISSRDFAPRAYNEDQRRKLFFSQLFSMIDGTKNSAKSYVNYENDNLLTSNNVKKRDIGVSSKQTNDKHRKSQDIDLENDVYVPLRKIKKRPNVQENRSFLSDNLRDNIYARPERQLHELINDDNANIQFYKLNKYSSRTSDDYESIEPSIEQEPYGPTGDDTIETSTLYISPTSTDSIIDNSSNEEVNYNTDLNNSSSSTLDSQSIVSVLYTTPNNNNITEVNNLIPTKYSRRKAKKIPFFKMNTTGPSLTTERTYTSNVEKSNEDFVEEVNKLLSREPSTNVNNVFITTDSPVDKTNYVSQSPYVNVPVEFQNDFVKAPSRRTQANSGNNNVKAKQTEHISKTEQKEAGRIQDAEVATVYGETDFMPNKNNVFVNPLSARIKLDFLIQLQPIGNHGY